MMYASRQSLKRSLIRIRVHGSNNNKPLETTFKNASSIHHHHHHHAATVASFCFFHTTCLQRQSSSNPKQVATKDVAAPESSSSQNNNSNNTTTKDIPSPPIKWTTHRLKPEQIEKVDAIFHKILWLDLVETSMLTDSINYKLGVKLTPKQRAALERQLEGNLLLGTIIGSGMDEEETDAAAAAAEEDAGPKNVDLKLTGFDAKNKIKVIKEVRAMAAGLGLKEAKELVESAPAVIQKDLKPEQAEELKVKLEAVGATVELA